MEKILIIDDDYGLRETLSGFLKSDGYIIIEAENGLSGIDAVKKWHPDLVLSDICMPIPTHNIIERNTEIPRLARRVPNGRNLVTSSSADIVRKRYLNSFGQRKAQL